MLTFLLVAFCGYMAGMLGTVAYAVAVYRSLRQKGPGNEGNVFLVIFMFEMIKWLQVPKVLVALAAAALGLWLFSGVGAAIGFATAACFVVSGLFLAWLSNRNGGGE
jgi:hypothetical protein